MTRSGQGECHHKVTTPTATIATLASVSLRADKKAARVRLPAAARWRASSTAQVVLTASAARPVAPMATAAGGAPDA